MAGNLLLDRAPESVYVNGAEYAIHGDFRTAIQFAQLMEQEELSDEEKIVLGNRLYYPVVPPDEIQAFQGVIEFWGGGASPYMSTEGEPSQPLYSFIYDAEYIYAAFLSQYKVDLQIVDLHWWKFKAMFASLSEDNEIVKIIGYRAMKITQDMNKEQRKFYERMKRKYALPDMRPQEEKDGELAQALWGG